MILNDILLLTAIAFWPILLFALALIVVSIWLNLRPISPSRAAKVLSQRAHRRPAAKRSIHDRLKAELGR